MKHATTYIALAGWLLLVNQSASSAEPLDFERNVRPLLKEKCVSCHGPDKQKSSLRLDAKSFAFRGGDSGAVIVPGNAKDSELLRRINSTDVDERMPPGKTPLTQEQIALLERWIKDGAEWPETEADRLAARDPRRDHWAWQAVKPIVPPEVKENKSAVRNEIDQFIFARLREDSLQPSPEAERRTLIRRLSFDLLGLPPTPEEIKQFEADPSPTAYETLVDHYLQSPHYGERAAQHWLDIAHYADTHGFERDQKREHAWRYRDWVIRAFNRDQPYNEFIRDQIAGDALRPSDPDAVMATGFLAAGPWDFVGQAETPSPLLKRLARADDLDDMVTQVMTATCGVTINCARCHDHKLDPISQREYYALWSVFAGVKRGNRIVSTGEEKQWQARRDELKKQINIANSQIRRLRQSWSLADIVGAGDGLGTGQANAGIDPITGKPQVEKRGFLEGAEANRFAKSSLPLVDGVVIPNGGESGEVPISSTGIIAKNVPRTSGKTWDAVRNGPINSQFSTKLGEIDFAQGEHTLLALHANAAITFDLAEFRKQSKTASLELRSQLGYFGQTPRDGASVRILLDGQLAADHPKIGRDDGLINIELAIPEKVRFLTLMATDAGNDISHDQICFVNACLEPLPRSSDAAIEKEIANLTDRRKKLEADLTTLVEPAQIYGVLSETPPPVHVLHRGNTESPKEEVAPGAIGCLADIPESLGGKEFTDAQRRIALAQWLTDAKHPLINRVIVNRLWQQHFGVGIVETPSDFGSGGGRPSHPELLDWLANKLQAERGSLKAIHRLICSSAAYRQQSRQTENTHDAAHVDSANRRLWRQTPRRLDAESLRDAVLAVSGKLDQRMYGPGFQDFDYKEEYAPVYSYIAPAKPELWRRSIYRFVVRTTPHPFLTTLDCPNPANLTPTRTITTTALQSLAMLNNEFILQQADHFAARLAANPPKSIAQQIDQAFELAFSRPPTQAERDAAEKLIKRHGLPAFCRFLLNANEFVVID